MNVKRSSLAAILALVIMCLFTCGPAYGDEQPSDEAHTPPSAGDLAIQLQNPVATLISVPFQNNVDFRANNPHNFTYMLKIQPVVPFVLSKDVNLILRPIFPIMVEQEPAPASGWAKGVADIEIQSYFTPTDTDPVIWGLGIDLKFPTGSDVLFSTGKFSAGPTAVICRQTPPWTFGLLANHTWSYAGESDRQNVSLTYLQPFVSYTWKSAWSLALNSETYYDWSAPSGSHWTVPINLTGSKVLSIWKQSLSLALAVRGYPKTPAGGADLGARFAVTLLFPR